MKKLTKESLTIFKNITESTKYEIHHKRVAREIINLTTLLNEAYFDIKSMRESGDAGFWEETDLEKKIKKQLEIK